MQSTFAVLAALALCAAPAAARPLGTRAALGKARKLLRRARDRAALDLLVKTLQRGGHAPRDTAQLHLLVGVARYNLGKRKAARRALRIALELDRDIALPGDVSPKISALVEKIRASIPPPKKRRSQPTPGSTGAPPAADGNADGRFGFKAADDGPGFKVADEPQPIASNAVDAPGNKRPGAAARVAAWIFGGVAVAAAASAITLGVLSGSRADEANDDTVPHLRAAELHDQAESFALGSNISWGVAAASAAASALFFYLGHRSAARVSVAPTSTAGRAVSGAVLSLQTTLW